MLLRPRGGIVLGATGPRWCALFAAALGALFACSNAVPQVAKGPHPQSGGVWPLPVDSRAPLPQVQVVPPRPNDSCYWLDGEWTWQRNTWTWREGSWVRFDSQCYYAQSTLTWQGGPGSEGVLYFTPAQWYHRSTQERCAPAVVCAR